MLHTTCAKITILSITIFLIIIGGVSMFRSIMYNKNVLEQDLRNYIPSEVSTVLQINQIIETVEFSSYIPEIDSTFLDIHTLLTYPIYLIKDQSKAGIIGKVTSEQEIVLKKELKKLFPMFPPKVKLYKGVKIYFYQTMNDHFYCCTFFNGLFVGGYKLDLLQKVMESSSTNNFFNNEGIKDISHNAVNIYSGNLFFRSADSAYVCNILTNENSLELDVYTNLENKEYLSPDSTKSIEIDYGIFPDKLIAFRISNTSPNLADTVSKLLRLPSYEFYTTTKQNQSINLLKNINDKFIVYNTINNLEFQLTGKRLNINDFAFNRQRIYTASPQLSKYIFRSEDVIFFSFYKEYLAYSKEKSVLIHYLKNNGKFDIIENNIVDEFNLDHVTNYENYFFDKNLTIFPILKLLNTIVNQNNTYSGGYTFCKDKKLNMNLSLYKIKN